MNRMIRLTVCAVALLFLPTVEKAQAQLAGSPWPVLTRNESTELLRQNSVSVAHGNWPCPRHDLQNTAASELLGQQMSEAPTELWTLTSDSSSKVSLYPVADDLDNDGKLEVVVGFRSMRGYELDALNCEDGTILWNYDAGSSFKWATPVIADINDDGQLDVVLGSRNSIVALNGSDASTIWSVPFSAPMGMAVANLDDDAFLEIITHQYGSAKIFLLDGKDGAEIWQNTTSGSAYNIPAVGDIDGDGQNEILCHNHRYDPSRERLYCWDKNGNEKWHFDALPSEEQSNNAPPELGYTPEFGYISTSIADFNADGNIEVGFGTRCHYYVLDRNGNLIWKVPLVEGWGVFTSYNADGTTYVDIHGTGGPSGYAAAIGDLDGDKIPEIAISLEPEFKGLWYEDSLKWVYSRIAPANKVVVLNGKNGQKLWEFEGKYSAPDSMESMHEPILVDVDGDSLLDVLVYSSDGNMHAIKGTIGEAIWKYAFTNGRGILNPTSRMIPN